MPGLPFPLPNGLPTGESIEAQNARHALQAIQEGDGGEAQNARHAVQAVKKGDGGEAQNARMALQVIQRLPFIVRQVTESVGVTDITLAPTDYKETIPYVRHYPTWSSNSQAGSPYGVDKLDDDDLDTYWRNNQNLNSGPTDLDWDFGSAKAFSLLRYGNWEEPTSVPSSVEIFWSDDDSSYTSVGTFSPDDTDFSWTEYAITEGPHRYWRMRELEGSSGSYWRIGGMELWGAGEYVSVTDAVSHIVGLGPLTEAVGVTDATSSIQEHAHTATDGAGVTDDTLHAKDATVVVSEATGVTDSTDRDIVAERTATDAVGVTDAVSDQLTSAGQEISTESVGIADSVLVRSPVVERTIQEPVGVTDDTSFTGTKTSIATDDVGVTDVVDREQIVERITADPAGITDTVTYVLDEIFEEASTDPVGVLDNVSYILQAPNSEILTDPAGVTDSVSYTRVVSMEVTITISTPDTAISMDATDGKTPIFTSFGAGGAGNSGNNRSRRFPKVRSVKGK